MRDLTSLHATMAAANKIGGAPPVSGRSRRGMGMASNGTEEEMIKQEERGMMSLGSLPARRPGTSMGYEGDMPYTPAGNSTWDQSPRNHSFRDSSQSFLAPSTTTSAAGTAAQSHSFRAFTSVNNTSNASSGRPSTASSTSRPPPSSGFADIQSQHPRSLPPLAAVVSATLAPSLGSPSQHSSSSVTPIDRQQQHSSQSFFPSFPAATAAAGSRALPLPLPYPFRRPGTASRARPGTAPASASFFSSSRPFSSSGRLGGGDDRLASSSSCRPDLSLLHSGFGGRSGRDRSDGRDDDGDVAMSPTGNDASPFYFSPPGLDTPSVSSSSTASSAPSNTLAPPANPRKRAYAGPDGPHDVGDDDGNDASPFAYHHLGQQHRPVSSSGLLFSGLSVAPTEHQREYEYGSESRPQSRRLSVMELCNDDSADDVRPTTSSGRPGTSSGRSTREQYVPGSGAFLLSAATAAANARAATASAVDGGTGNRNDGARTPTAAATTLSGAAAAAGTSAKGTTARDAAPSASTTGYGSTAASHTPPPFVGSSAGYGSTSGDAYGGYPSSRSRPTTSSGLVSGAEALRIFDASSPGGSSSSTFAASSTVGQPTYAFASIDARKRQQQQQQRERDEPDAAPLFARAEDATAATAGDGDADARSGSSARGRDGYGYGGYGYGRDGYGGGGEHDGYATAARRWNNDGAEQRDGRGGVYAAAPNRVSSPATTAATTSPSGASSAASSGSLSPSTAGSATPTPSTVGLFRSGGVSSSTGPSSSTSAISSSSHTFLSRTGAYQFSHSPSLSPRSPAVSSSSSSDGGSSPFAAYARPPLGLQQSQSYPYAYTARGRDGSSVFGGDAGSPSSATGGGGRASPAAAVPSSSTATAARDEYARRDGFARDADASSSTATTSASSAPTPDQIRIATVSPHPATPTSFGMRV